MDSTIITLIVAVATLIIGLIIGKILFTKNSQKLIDEAQQHADRLIKEAEIQAETLKEKKKLEAKEHFLQLKSEHEKQVKESEKQANQRNQKLNEIGRAHV